jgi:PKHD-type hydroxylase
VTTPSSWFLGVDHQEHYAWFERVFSPSECQTIIEFGVGNLKNAFLLGGRDDSSKRNSRTHFLQPEPDTHWIFERLSGVITQGNDQFFGFDLVALSEGIQFTEYSGEGAHYTWHVDKGYHYSPRKLSLTVQLSDPASYEGGDLELFYGIEPEPMGRTQGSVHMFASTMLHRVTPIVSGTRYSLVAWVTGPPFR